MREFSAIMADALTAYLGSKNPAQIPAGGLLLWRWFTELSLARSYHANGPNPLAFADIEAYGRLMRIPMEPRHVAILKAMDAAWLQYVARRQPKPANDGRPARSERPLSPALFDAVFG